MYLSCKGLVIMYSGGIEIHSAFDSPEKLFDIVPSTVNTQRSIRIHGARCHNGEKTSQDQPVVDFLFFCGERHQCICTFVNLKVEPRFVFL